MASGGIDVSRRRDFDCFTKSEKFYDKKFDGINYGLGFESGKGGSDLGVNQKRVLEDESPKPKRRRYSPITWDREEKEIRVSSKNRVVPRSTPVVGSEQEVVSDDGVVSVETIVESKQVGSAFSEILEEEDPVPPRNISMSRWASDSDSPCELHSPSDNVERRSLSRESGEFRQDESVGDTGRSSGSVGKAGSVKGDEYLESELEDNDLMDVDVKSDLGLDSQDESDICGIESPIQQRGRNMLMGCRSVYEFERLNKINEGTYGVVYRARDKSTGELVALKKVKTEREREGFPITALREINILMSIHHPSIVDVKEVVMDDHDGVYMVMEYMEHDLKGVMEAMKQPFSQSEVKCLMLQLLEGVKCFHDNWVLHRDLKTSNLLLNNQGELKVCDFGMARRYGSPLKPYTSLVVTLWYRAPELLLGAKQYSTAVDMWSVGCIMAELLGKEPLFKGKSEIEQLNQIFKTLGTPNDTIWPGVSKLPGFKASFSRQPYNLLRKKFPATSFTGLPALSDSGFDLLNRLLTYDPDKRVTVDEALNHAWFREVPLPKSRDFMPTFPSRHARR